MEKHTYALSEGPKAKNSSKNIVAFGCNILLGIVDLGCN